MATMLFVPPDSGASILLESHACAKIPGGLRVRELRADHRGPHGRSLSDQFQYQGGSFVMLAKGNRSPVVTEYGLLLPRLDRRAPRRPRPRLHPSTRTS